MLNKSAQKVAFGIIGFALITFILIKVFVLFGNMADSQTEKSRYIVIKDKITITGIAVRDEESVYKNTDGFVVYHYSNGERMSADQVVASIYNDESDVVKNDRINALTKEINLLTEAKSSDSSSGAYMETIVKKLTTDVTSYVNKVQKNSLSGIDDLKSNITFLLNSRNISIDKSVSFDDTIAKLTYERDNLQQSMSVISSDIKVPSAGYFVNFIDGYENLTLDSVKSMEAETLSEILKSYDTAVSKNQSTGTIGKVLKGYDWYFAAVVPNDYLSKISKGKKYNLSFVFDESYEMPGKVVEIKTRQGEDDSIVVFECNRMNSKLSEMRIAKIDVVFNEISGITVPKSAIRMPNGVTGVHVVFGETLVFKEINMIYETEDYYISEIREVATEDEYEPTKRFLQVNDRIVVPGNTS